MVLRSVWDYSQRVEEFLAWCAAVGPERLRNRPELVAFDADKRYLGELGVRIAPTTFVGPGDPLPDPRGRGRGEAERLGRRPRHRPLRTARATPRRWR